MKNVLFIVLDSVFEEVMSSNPNICPFINSIKNKSLYFSNIYSQGPYTEAGTKGLLCSENTLDNDSYFFRYSKAKNFISNIFKDSGYKTTSIIYPTTLYNKKIVDGLDEIYLTSVFLPSVFWEQKLSFYKPFWEDNKITKEDYMRIYELLDDVFFFWTISVDKKNYSKYLDLLLKYDQAFSFEEMYNYVVCEKTKYEKNKKEYVDNLFLTDGAALKVDTFSQTDIIKKNTLQKVMKQEKKFCNKLIAKQLCIELKKIRLLMDVSKRQPVIEKIKLLKTWINDIRRSFDIITVKKSKDYKLLLSAKSQLGYVSELLQKNQGTPQFIMAHIEEPHYYNTFFSYDCLDTEEIHDEFRCAEEYLNEIKGSSYGGSIYYDLSLRYVDRQIKKLFEELDTKGLLNDTTIVLTSDHGSSYTGRYIRSNRVVNFYPENYHIPFIIYDNDISGKTVDDLASNIDIIPTLLDYLNINVPSNIAGRSILSSSNRDYIFIEHVGSGCPDIYYKPAWIAIRNNHYQINYIGRISEEFSENNIESIYDIQIDYKQIKNIKDDVDNDEINQLINIIEKRFEELKYQYTGSR